MTPVQALLRILIASLLVFAGSLSPNPAKAQPAPQTLTIAGLRDRVTVRRDERGIPYIEAANDQDLYFAQGYITAQHAAMSLQQLGHTHNLHLFGDRVDPSGFPKVLKGKDPEGLSKAH